MSVEQVRAYLEPYGVAERVRLFDVSTATVPLAAAALGTEPERIAKTMAFYEEADLAFVVVMAGDARVNNRQFKDRFKKKAKMLKGEDTERLTGHPAGGVCPFALPAGVKVYLDESLKRFTTVFPACGTANSAIELTPEELEHISGAEGWVAVATYE